MEEMSFTKDDTPQNLANCWTNITHEYNNRLGTNFTKMQVRKKWDNHVQKMKFCVSDTNTYRDISYYSKITIQIFTFAMEI